MTDLSNSLADLAERVKEATRLSALAARTSADQALEAGRLLGTAKEQCRHGDWLPFLQRANIHERQARRFMQLAASGLNGTQVSDLGGIKAALEWLKDFRLPGDGDMLLVLLDEFAHGRDAPLAFVWAEEGGHHVVMFDLNEASPHSICTKRPVLDEAAARQTIFQALDFRLGEMRFATVPHSDAMREIVRVAS